MNITLGLIGQRQKYVTEYSAMYLLKLDIWSNVVFDCPLGGFTSLIQTFCVKYCVINVKSTLEWGNSYPKFSFGDVYCRKYDQKLF